MKDGVYLLAMAGDDFAVPVTLTNHTTPDGLTFQLLAGVAGVKLVQNLEPGYRLLPLVVAPTPAVLDAFDRVLDRLVGVFDNDANSMPEQLLDDYLAARAWVDEQPIRWTQEGDPGP